MDREKLSMLPLHSDNSNVAETIVEDEYADILSGDESSPRASEAQRVRWARAKARATNAETSD
jgi:hypothetical protein